MDPNNNTEYLSGQDLRNKQYEENYLTNAEQDYSQIESNASTAIDAFDQSAEEADGARAELEGKTKPTEGKANATKDSPAPDREAKSSYETKDAKEFGLEENAKDALNAVVAGGQDIWNNTVTVGKLFDPEFYKSSKPGEYKYDGLGSGLAIEQSNLPKTVWGKFIRGTVDVVGGFIGVGKATTAVRGLSMLGKGVQVANTAKKATLASRALTGVKTGAVVTMWDQDSDSANFSQMAAEAAPSFFAWNPIKTSDAMSPFQRSALNTLEGVGLDSVFGVIFSGSGNKSRAISDGLEKRNAEVAKVVAKEVPNAPPSLTQKGVDLSREIYDTQKASVEGLARAAYLEDQWKALKNAGIIPKRKGITDITNLASKDQILLMREIVHASKLMKKVFKTQKLNVEKIGNIVPQLHIHIIARYKKDNSWPLSVWVVKGKPYSAKALKEVVNKIRIAFK